MRGLSPELAVLLLVFALTGVTTMVSFFLRAELRPRRRWLLAAAAPALIFLAGYYALAVHMQATLGG